MSLSDKNPESRHEDGMAALLDYFRSHGEDELAARVKANSLAAGLVLRGYTLSPESTPAPEHRR